MLCIELEVVGGMARANCRAPLSHVETSVMQSIYALIRVESRSPDGQWGSILPPAHNSAFAIGLLSNSVYIIV